LAHGDFFGFHENGSIKIKGFYKDDKPNGEWSYYNLFNSVIRKNYYEDGKQINN